MPRVKKSPKKASDVAETTGEKKGRGRPKKSPDTKEEARPSYKQMVKSAVDILNEKNGSSKIAIMKYITANFKVEKGDKKVVVAIRKMVENGELVHTNSKNSGAAGSVQLPSKMSDYKKGKVGAAKVKKSPKKAPNYKPPPKKLPKIPIAENSSDEAQATSLDSDSSPVATKTPSPKKAKTAPAAEDTTGVKKGRGRPKKDSKGKDGPKKDSKGRGRPKKNPDVEAEASTSSEKPESTGDTAEQPTKKRGRPKKTQ